MHGEWRLHRPSSKRWASDRREDSRARYRLEDGARRPRGGRHPVFAKRAARVLGDAVRAHQRCARHRPAASFAVTAAVLAMGLAMAPHDVGILLGGQVAGFVVPMRITLVSGQGRALRRRAERSRAGRPLLGLASSFRRLRIHVLSPRSPAHPCPPHQITVDSPHPAEATSSVARSG